MPVKNKVRFEKGINSPEESYWLGFLVGDGVIYENRYRVRLPLQKRDKRHLEKFVNFLGYKKDKIHLYSSTPEARIDSKRLLINLYNLGLRQNKVHKTHRGLIPKKYQRDFIRGLFDADGTIYSPIPKNSESRRADFHICGTKDLLEGVREVFVKNINGINADTGCISTSSGESWTLEYKGRWVVDKIGHYLYDGANVYLERKYKVFQSLLNYNKTHPRLHNMFNKEDIYKIKRLYKKEKITQLKIAKILNVSQPFISRIINNKRYQRYA